MGSHGPSGNFRVVLSRNVKRSCAVPTQVRRVSTNCGALASAGPVADGHVSLARSEIEDPITRGVVVNAVGDVPLARAGMHLIGARSSRDLEGDASLP